MDKWIMAVGVVAILVWTNTVSAGPVGSAADPAVLKQGVIWKGGAVGLVIGEESDFIRDRHFQDSSSEMEFSFHGLKLGASLFNTILIYGIGGIADATVESAIEPDSAFYWGGGITIVLFEKRFTQEDIFRVGFDGKYRGCSFDISRVNIITVSGTGTEAVTDVKSYDVDASWDYYEWQAAVTASFQLYAAIPYIGVKYSDIGGDASFRAGDREMKMENNAEKNIGVFVGCSFDIKQFASVTVEARFLDEQAFSVGGMIRF